jgi:hypothetical protein
MVIDSKVKVCHGGHLDKLLYCVNKGFGLRGLVLLQRQAYTKAMKFKLGAFWSF